MDLNEILCIFIYILMLTISGCNVLRYFKEGEVIKAPEASCDGFIFQSLLDVNEPLLSCALHCEMHWGCDKFYYKDLGNGSSRCIATKGTVVWSSSPGTGFTVYSKFCSRVVNVTTNARDCKDLYNEGNNCSATYTIYPDGMTPVTAFCDMETDMGGWTVIQRRSIENSTDFFVGWNEYKQGFGTNTDFWLGNQWIHELTKNGDSEIFIILIDWSLVQRFARYSTFSIGPESDNFRLNLNGFTGSIGDSFTYNNGSQFSTKDADNDNHGSHCAVDHHRGGWWFDGCSNVELNGRYFGGPKYDAKSNFWFGFHGWESLRSSVMMVRRRS